VGLHRLAVERGKDTKAALRDEGRVRSRLGDLDRVGIWRFDAGDPVEQERRVAIDADCPFDRPLTSAEVIVLPEF
jgi:hypothetical protein